MSNRKNLNFVEYQLRGSQNRCFALPNFSYGKTTIFRGYTQIPSLTRRLGETNNEK